MPSIVDRLHAAMRSCILPLLGLVATAHCVQTAHGQLRTGRTARALYSDVVGAAQEPVVTASGQEEIYFEDDGFYGESVVGEGLLDTGTGCDSCGNAPMDFGGHASGCGCGIAPGAVAFGGQGCGPLMAIWSRLRVRAEVPLYWRRAAGPPPLVTTSTNGGNGTLPAGAGTTVLLGDGPLNEDATAGFRLNLSTWLGQNQEFGLMFRYWTAGDQDDTFNFSSTTNPTLARPFFNTTVTATPVQDSQIIASPGNSTGSISVASSSTIDGIDLGIRRRLYQDRFTRVDWLWGYKHVRIDEGLSIASNTTVVGGNPGLLGARIAVNDNFQTENDFNGVSYGLMSTRRFARWKMETLIRLGAGNLRRRVNIVGSTTTTSAAGAVSNSNEGLLARNTNRQPYEDDTFVVIPELGINFAYLIAPGLDVNIGYQYTLIPKVAQASQQINDDLAVNLSNPLTGGMDPALNFDERKFWLQSLGFGFQLRY